MRNQELNFSFNDEKLNDKDLINIHNEMNMMLHGLRTEQDVIELVRELALDKVGSYTEEDAKDWYQKNAKLLRRLDIVNNTTVLGYR
tara:strand:+ start:4516 stop:4776 length:261 start_codon:yes stop_codon:yes gene_type:complete